MAYMPGLLQSMVNLAKGILRSFFDQDCGIECHSNSAVIGLSAHCQLDILVHRKHAN